MIGVNKGDGLRRLDLQTNSVERCLRMSHALTHLHFFIEGGGEISSKFSFKVFKVMLDFNFGISRTYLTVCHYIIRKHFKEKEIIFKRSVIVIFSFKKCISMKI